MSQVSLVGVVKGGGRGTKSARYGKENRMARPRGNTNRGCCVSCGYYQTVMSQVSLVGGVGERGTEWVKGN